MDLFYRQMHTYKQNSCMKNIYWLKLCVGYASKTYIEENTEEIQQKTQQIQISALRGKGNK